MERLVTSQAGSLSYLAINTQRDALADVRVRRALEYAVDRKAFILAQGGELAATKATTLITPGTPGRVDFDLYPAGEQGDVDKAKQLLTEAGHADDLELTLWCTNDDAAQIQAQAVQQGLQRAGVAVTIVPLDPEVFYAEATGDATPDYDLLLGWWLPDFPSAAGNIALMFDSSQVGGGGYNLSRYASAEADALIAQATAAVDPAEAQALWVRADRLIMEDAAAIPLSYTRNSFLRGSDVANVFVAPFPPYQNYLTITLR
jgi:peptide/nickel transport system substrate-binding protein